MHVQDGFAPAEFFPYGFQARIAGPVTLLVIGINADPIAFQRVVRISDFLQRTFDIGERYGRKESEAFGIVLHALRAEVIHGADGGARLFRIVIDDVARLCEREDCNTDAEFVHLLNGLLRCPRRQASATTPACSAATAATTPTETWGRKVMMDVNASAPCGRFVSSLLGEQSAGRRHGAGSNCGQRLQEFASIFHSLSSLTPLLT